MAFFGYAGIEAHEVWEEGVSSLFLLIQRMGGSIAPPYACSDSRIWVHKYQLIP